MSKIVQLTWTYFKRTPPLVINACPNTNEVIAISFIRILILGPLVSFIGSPTVSPIIALICAVLFLPYTTPSTFRFPPSIYFLALSQAPPVLENEMAI